MNRTGWVFAAVALVAGSGVGIGAIAHVASGGEGAGTAVVGSAAALEWVPETATVIGQIDLTLLAESDIAGIWLEALPARDASESIGELRERTGIDPRKDVSRLTFSVVETRPSEASDARDDGRSQPWGLVMDGTFDRETIVRKMNEKAETTSEVHEGITIHRVEAHEDDGFALAFPDASNLLLIGEPAYLRDMIAAGLGRTGSATSGSLMAAWSAAWNEGIEGETFWIVGRPAAGMSALLGNKGAPALPPLQSFTLSGRLSQDLSLRARGLASDATAAQQLADVARGFLALGRLNEGVTDELRGLLDTVMIGQVDEEVEVTMTVPHDTLVRFIEQQSADRDRDR